ncbi:MAG: cupin domain-containing protein [Janthinobacterium lividum]
MRRIVRPVATGLLLLAACHGAAAVTPEIPYWDNWTDSAGISHLTLCRLHRFSLESVAKPATPEWRDRQEAGARTILAHVEPPGWVSGWHENPAVQWIMPISGTWSVQAMDGSQATVGPGEIVVGEDQHTKADTAGHKGHLARNPGAVPVSLMIVQMMDLPQTGKPCRFE